MPDPAGGEFSDNLTEMSDWVTRLDRSYLAIQGPPGTGKTYCAAHLVYALILSGRRVGITALGHNAIDNLLEAVVAVFAEYGKSELLRAVRNAPDGIRQISGVTYPKAKKNKRCAEGDFNLIGGTPWLFASPDMRGAPVDTLLVDEAGQLALADGLAASTAAHNVVLLGDPLQLPQVSHAVHPGASGASVLDHVIGDDVTVPPDRGVFLSEIPTHA